MSSVTSAAPAPRILDPLILKGLSDRLYEKRKLAALEIEKVVKEMVLTNPDDEHPVFQITKLIASECIGSLNSNMRKGGLTGLAAVAIAVPQHSEGLARELIIPILRCFKDSDSRVRYYACEALYNVIKVSRHRIVMFFNDIFENLARLSADVDQNVKNGVQLVDRLMKDVITETDGFDLQSFIPVLRECAKVSNAQARQFIIGWISVLNMVPDFDLSFYLPEFLGGLFEMLADPALEIRTLVESTLSQFLLELSETPATEYGPMVEILVFYSKSKDVPTRKIALNWIHEFLLIGGGLLLQFTAALIDAVLPSLSHQDYDIREIAGKVNNMEMKLIAESNKDPDVGRMLGSVTTQLECHSELTRQAAIVWVKTLLNVMPNKMLAHVDSLFPLLLKTLSDSSEEVVVLDLEVLGIVSVTDENFRKVVDCLLKLFYKERKLMETRGVLVIQKLAAYLGPQKSFLTFSSLLQEETDIEFASDMVQTLNLIMLTSVEFLELRTDLRNSMQSAEGQQLFEAIYRSWSHNPVATLSLCLLAETYEHTYNLIRKIGEFETNVALLMQIDQLVRMIESPVYASLRLQMLEPEKYPHLIKSMYGLLMILPQGPADCCAFSQLQNRLNCVQTMCLVRMTPKSEAAPGGSGWRSKIGRGGSEEKCNIDFSALLTHFSTMAEKHHELPADKKA